MHMQFARKVPKLAREKSRKWFGKGSKVMDESTELTSRGMNSDPSLRAHTTDTFIGAIQKKEASFVQQDPEAGNVSIGHESISTQPLLPNMSGDVIVDASSMEDPVDNTHDDSKRI